MLIQLLNSVCCWRKDERWTDVPWIWDRSRARIDSQHLATGGNKKKVLGELRIKQPGPTIDQWEYQTYTGLLQWDSQQWLPSQQSCAHKWCPEDAADSNHHFETLGGTHQFIAPKGTPGPGKNMKRPPAQGYATARPFSPQFLKAAMSIQLPGSLLVPTNGTFEWRARGVNTCTIVPKNHPIRTTGGMLTNILFVYLCMNIHMYKW